MVEMLWLAILCLSCIGALEGVFGNYQKGSWALELVIVLILIVQGL